jgi:hypothetical protein
MRETSPFVPGSNPHRSTLCLAYLFKICSKMETSGNFLQDILACSMRHIQVYVKASRLHCQKVPFPLHIIYIVYACIEISGVTIRASQTSLRNMKQLMTSFLWFLTMMNFSFWTSATLSGLKRGKRLPNNYLN